ncbi:hypothetical protein F5Y18DRAFT_438671 [Xylariaceae sp. FL1019]|nr:hypothetical protein F5Y18DRAFT_438671 [Xylariaceae sp. FL1019]
MEQPATFGTKLPTELRLNVWELALENETSNDSSNRLIILYQIRVIPTKNLISPLLSTTRESRRCALKYYNVKLAIYKVPTPQPNEAFYQLWVDAVKANKFLAARKHQCFPPYPAESMEWLHTGSFQINTKQIVANIENLEKIPSSCYVMPEGNEKPGKIWGSIYIKPDSDTFVKVEQPASTILAAFWEAAAAQDRGEPPLPHQLLCNSITAKVPLETFSKIKKVVLAQSITEHYNESVPTASEHLSSFAIYASHREPFMYTLTRAESLWNKPLFSNLEYWGHLWYEPARRSLERDLVGGRRFEPYSRRLPIRQWTEINDVVPVKILRDVEGRKMMVEDYEEELERADALEKFCMDWMEKCVI